MDYNQSLTINTTMPSYYCPMIKLVRAIHIVSGLVAFLINMGVAIICITRRSVREKTYPLLVNLLIADAIFGVPCALFGSQEQLRHCEDSTEDIDFQLCYTSGSFIIVGVQLSAIAALCVTIGRLVGVSVSTCSLKPVGALKNDLAFVLMPVPWLFTIASIVILVIKKPDNFEVVTFCHLDVIDLYIRKWFALIKIICFMTMFICYSVVLLLLKWNTKRIRRSDQTNDHRLKASRTILTILGIYLVFWIAPMLAIAGMSHGLRPSNIYDTELISCYLLSLPVLTCTANAILFISKSPELQHWCRVEVSEKLKQLVKKRLGKRHCQEEFKLSQTTSASRSK